MVRCCSVGPRWRGPRRIPACQSRRRGRERNRPLAPLAALLEDLLLRKTSSRSASASCPPALLRLRAFRRRDTPRTEPRHRGPPPPEGAHHGRHHLPFAPHHDPLRSPPLREPDPAGRVHLHRRLRTGLPRLRRSAPGVVGRRLRAAVLIPGLGAHWVAPLPGEPARCDGSAAGVRLE